MKHLSVRTSTALLAIFALTVITLAFALARVL